MAPIKILRSVLMTKIVAILCIFDAFFFIASAQRQKGEIDFANLPVSKDHYLPEFTFDHPIDSGRWLTEAAGLHVSFVASNQHYFRTEVPGVKETAEWRETGWKGERLNAMILVWSPDTLSQVRITLHNLVNSKGGILSKKSMLLNLVRYVISN